MKINIKFIWMYKLRWGLWAGNGWMMHKWERKMGQWMGLGEAKLVTWYMKGNCLMGSHMALGESCKVISIILDNSKKEKNKDMGGLLTLQKKELKWVIGLIINLLDGFIMYFNCRKINI